MKCIIVDDEAAARAITKQLCKKIDELTIVEEFDNAIGAIKYLNTNTVDLIFLDIHMPTFSGFDFIQTLKNPPLIILTTSDRNFALDAFEYDCVVDYLVKPISPERFAKAVARIKERSATQHAEEIVSANPEETTKAVGNDLYVNIDRRLVKINVPDICVIEAKGDYIKIKAEDKNYVVHSTLKKIEEKLPSHLFLKVHRSYIINTTKIVDIEDNSVLIKQDVIPVSRANRKELMQRLNLL
ncbi:LytTR family two component transcriptional regulator [Kordia periserrulae]|uniref:LytTR family two component transcriptional regulator n=1 Tax=Kordia periserrulae TaxID=701523 RepID=A0A2T6C623_9FLAO|nr:LytTR family DNA-binding domain-containing protein [Kordia periserrulae]PTX63743.1 LytTR family two component transcriptional regulator [Kordia periserrulae]